MALTITEPIKTVNGLLTQAIAAISQLLYQVQREDLEADNVTNSTINVGELRLFMSKTTYPVQPLQAGELIFIGGGDIDTYHGLYTVGDDNGDGAQWKFEIGGVYQGVGQVGGFVNQNSDRQGYRIEVQLFDKDNELLFNNIFSYVPNQAGFVTIDVGTLMSFNLTSSSTFSFSREYYLEMTEKWNGGQESTVQTTLLQAVLAEKQLLKTGGANMWEYLLVEGGSIRGQLLTRFQNPKMWRGWNRTCAALIDQEYQNRTGFSITRFRTQSYDINKVALGSITETADRNTTPEVIIQPITFTEVTNAFYVGCVLIGSSTVNVSVLLFYQLEEECPQPIMLDWINSKGGVDQWQFNIAQEVVLNVGEGILSEQVIDSDIEFITRTKQRFPGSSAERITCIAEHLTPDQLQALHEIKQTQSLRVYLSKDGTSFIDAVVVSTFSTAFNTKNRNHKFTVTIEFPDDFDFFEGKLY